jgi:hypothetical protein
VPTIAYPTVGGENYDYFFTFGLSSSRPNLFFNEQVYITLGFLATSTFTSNVNDGQIRCIVTDSLGNVDNGWNSLDLTTTAGTIILTPKTSIISGTQQNFTESKYALGGRIKCFGTPAPDGTITTYLS